MLLIDASVWLAALDKDDRFYPSARALTTAGSELATLDLTLYEVANTVTRRFKAATPAVAAVSGVLAACGGNLARVDIDTISSAAELATEYGLTAYDASYVAVARRYDWTLVSADIKDLVSRGLAIAPGDPAIS